MLDSIRNSSQSVWVKFAFGVIILVFVFWGIGSYQASSGVVATVNNVDITEQDFARMYNAQYERLRASFPNVTSEQLRDMQFSYVVLESLIAQSLLTQEAERTNIDVSSRELFNIISTFPFTQDQSGKFNADVYKRALSNAGQTPKMFEDNLKKDMREEKFKNSLGEFAFVSPLQARQFFEYQFEERAFNANFIEDVHFIEEVNPSEEDLLALYEERKAYYQVPASIELELIEVTAEKLAKPENITDADIQAEYENNRNLYDIPENVTASHILVSLAESATAADEEKAMDTLAIIQAELDAGVAFEELAKTYSADYGSAQNGGFLGTFTRGQMVAPFEEVAFSQEVGTVSKPVRTRFGYHLIKLDAREESKALEEEELKKIVGTKLAELEALARVQTVLDSLLVQTHITGADAETFAKAAQSEGLEVESTGLISFESLASMYQLQNSDTQLLNTLAIGTVLDSPLATANGFFVVRIKDKSDARTRTFDEIKEDILVLAKEREAHKQALAFAENLVELKAFEELGESYSMSRNGAFELGYNMKLAEDLFAAPEDSGWLTEVYEVEKGYVIIWPREVLPIDEEEWKTQEATLMEQMRMSRENMFFSLYTQVLRENAEIRIINQAYFQ